MAAIVARAPRRRHQEDQDAAVTPQHGVAAELVTPLRSTMVKQAREGRGREEIPADQQAASPAAARPGSRPDAARRHGGSSTGRVVGSPR